MPVPHLVHDIDVNKEMKHKIIKIIKFLIKWKVSIITLSNEKKKKEVTIGNYLENFSQKMLVLKPSIFFLIFRMSTKF